MATFQILLATQGVWRASSLRPTAPIGANVPRDVDFIIQLVPAVSQCMLTEKGTGLSGWRPWVGWSMGSGVPIPSGGGVCSPQSFFLIFK